MSHQIAHPTRTNEGKTIALHRALWTVAMNRLEARGIKVRKKGHEIPREYWLARALDDPYEKYSNADEMRVQERRADHASNLLHDNVEFPCETYGIDVKEFQAKLGKPQEELHQRRAEEFVRIRPQLQETLGMRGFSGRQLCARLAILEQRALDPATDGNLIGVDYLHDPYRKLSLAGPLSAVIPTAEIKPGFRTYQIPMLTDGRFLYSTPNTTDAYTINTTEDPGSSSQVWTPKKLMAGIMWNGEFTEEALFPVVPALTASMVRGAAIAGDLAVLSGDTTAGAGLNINAFGGSLVLGTKDPRKIYKGLRRIYYDGTHGGKSAGGFAGGISGGGNAAAVTDVYAMLKKLGKYAATSQKANLHLVLSCQSKWGIIEDSTGSFYGQEALARDIFSLDWIEMANGRATEGASSEVPTDALDVMEGCPINLNNVGVYVGAGQTLSTMVAFNDMNYLRARKRSFGVKVVDLDLGDQSAIVSSFREDFQEIQANEPSLVVAYNLI